MANAQKMGQEVVAENTNKDKPQAAKRMKKMPKEAASQADGEVIEAVYDDGQEAQQPVTHSRQDKRPIANYAIFLAIIISLIGLSAGGLALWEQRQAAALQQTQQADISHRFEARLIQETAALHEGLKAQEAIIAALQNKLLSLQDTLAKQRLDAPSAVSAISAEGILAWEMWQMIAAYQTPSGLLPLIEKLPPSNNKAELRAILAEAELLLAGDLLAEGQAAYHMSDKMLGAVEESRGEEASIVSRMTRWAADFVKLQPLAQTKEQPSAADSQASDDGLAPSNIAAIRLAMTGLDTPQSTAWLTKIAALEALEIRLFGLIDNWLFEEVPQS